ncbi:hypothetical protein HDV64DRAFT_258055 [Trichoderma sp. TUCIM 5745]
MDVTDIETTEPIFRLATECETLFLGHLSSLKNGSDFNGAKVVGEYQQRFSAWAAFLGVFAVPDMCLDRRLRNHVEIRDIVIRLLDIMKRNLIHLFEEDEEDIDIPDLNRDSSPHIRVNLENLRGIEGAVDRLNHLGRTIQRSSDEGQATKINKFAKTFDSTSFEGIARLAVKSFYPDASASLLDQLVQAMTDMYEKFHYRRSRQVRLQTRPKQALFTIGEDPASDSVVTERASLQPTAPPVVDANKQLPRLISMTHLEDRSHKSRESKPTSLDSREFSRLFPRQGGGSVGSKTRSILVSQVAYPQPSEESLVCEWCFATLSKDDFKGEKWKKHLNEDFKPFFCISEKCKGHENRFATSRAWFSHMLETHGQNWHREVHLPIWWICPLCNNKETTFSRAQDLSEHISTLHDDVFTKSQIQVIAHQSQLRSPRPQDMCPLCCLSMKDEQDKDTEEQHLKAAQSEVSLGDQTSGESHKRVKTETGSIPQIQYDSLDLKGETKEMISDTKISSAENTQRVNIEAIAKHVAAHLQGIMLFTLRMMSLDAPNAKADEKSLSSSTNQDSSRAGSAQQHFEEETGAIVDMPEEQADGMEIDDHLIEDTIPDCEHIIDWQDVIDDTQQFSETDSFLQEVIRSGAFHFENSKILETDASDVAYSGIISQKDSKESTARASNLPPRNEHFVCPEDLFSRLTLISSGPANRVALVGLGGIGKSQLALELAHRTAAQSPEVWIFWVQADTLENLQNGFRKIAERIKLKEQKFSWKDLSELVWDDLYQLVCDWLHAEQYGRWILILDGSDDPDVQYTISEITNALEFELWSTSKIYIDGIPRHKSLMIITTRNRHLANTLTRRHDSIIEVGPMPVVEAISLFRKVLGPRFRPALDMNAAIHFVKGLGLNPLAITQAALYLGMYMPKTTTLVDYLEKLEESAAEKTRLLHFDDSSILKTWKASFDFICSQRPSAANLLWLMSFFDRRGIPKWLLVSDIRGNNTPRANSPSIMGRLELDDSDGVTNDESTDTFDGDIDILMKHHIISANRTRDMFEMHVLVQLAARMSMSDAETQIHSEQFIHRLATEFPTSPLVGWSTCQELFEHVQEAAKCYPSEDAVEEWMTLLFNGARYARLLGDLETARQMSIDVSRMQRKMRPEGDTEDDIRNLENTSLTALILMDQGLYEEAEKAFIVIRDAFTMMEATAETAYYNKLTSMNNLASVYRVQGRWKEAEKLLTQVRYERAEVNNDGPSALATLANLASTYRAQGRYVEATALQEVVLESCKIELGESHLQTLTNMSNLASMYRIRGELDKAEELQVQATNIRNVRFGKEHPDTLTSMNSLASIFRAQGRLWDAEELQVQVVELRRTKLGSSHPNTMASMNNLALIFYEQGKGEKAVELQTRVVDMCKVNFGESHPHTLTSINNLAVIWKGQGQDEEAMRLMKSCCDARQNILGQEHPYTISSGAILRRWSE